MEMAADALASQSIFRLAWCEIEHCVRGMQSCCPDSQNVGRKTAGLLFLKAKLDPVTVFSCGFSGSFRWRWDIWSNFWFSDCLFCLTGKLKKTGRYSNNND